MKKKSLLFSKNSEHFLLSDKIEQQNFKSDVLGIQVSNILKDAIFENILKGGEKLVEADLQRQFGISRSPLREALRHLEKEGFVVIIPRKGAFVKRIEQEDIQNNYPVRAVLEAFAAESAYKNMGENDFDEMELSLLNMKRAVRLGDTKNYWKHHIVFHDIFINATGNDILINILRNLRMHSLWYKFSYQNTKEELQNSFIDHQKIFHLFKEESTDIQELKSLVQSHIEDAFIKFLSYLETQEKGSETED